VIVTSLRPLVVCAAFCLETGTDFRDPFMSDFSCKIGRIYSISVSARNREKLNASKSLLWKHSHLMTVGYSHAIFIIRRRFRYFLDERAITKMIILLMHHASSKALDVNENSYPKCFTSEPAPVLQFIESRYSNGPANRDKTSQIYSAL
jgi:hypothetical protein